ncbi:F-box/LRR-repeat protein 4-like isoform X2 [Tubulanus polymorphus]|uniref:F-box/LRR-repeat protein 4-like isoform X2 n=1 Tax=Tubulanus polymorphus TaxID=672921 RepID=UPI003DA41430
MAANSSLCGGDRITGVPDTYSQFAEKVTDFSSQYGGEASIAYTAANLANAISIYPSYGDYTQACVFRTYGPWWKISPSAPTVIRRTPDTFFSTDFIELQFSVPVHPFEIRIYETYNPGAVVRILAVDTVRKRWEILWSGEPTDARRESRIFSPKLMSIPSLTSKIRLELNSKYCTYYTELDAVELIGSLQQMNSVLSVDTKYPAAASKNALEITTERFSDLNLDVRDTDYFSLLPGEIIQLIFSYLDHRSLCQVASVSRLFHKQAYDPLQYTALNLQPYWDKFTDVSLVGLRSRCCQHLQTLNISWCNNITSTEFIGFLKACSSLVDVRLGCCKFVNDNVIKSIATCSKKLKQLDVQCCRNVFNFLPLATNSLELRRLNLYRTNISSKQIVNILKTQTKLQYLNLGSCLNLMSNFDVVAGEIGRNCKSMIGLDFWRMKSLTDSGLNLISENCPHLEDVDLGWCSGVSAAMSDCLANLISRCRKLKKLFLTANRTVSDTELNLIAKYLPDLQQLDILGTSAISTDAVQKVLDECRQLVFLDVSFCAAIDFMQVHSWNSQYPRVDIKKSFQSG